MNLAPYPSASAASGSLQRLMQSHILDEAAKIVTDPLVLVNAVSKRVRQLSKGQRPMVETGVRADLADTALREIIEGKLAVRSDGEIVPVL